MVKPVDKSRMAISKSTGMELNKMAINKKEKLKFIGVASLRLLALAKTFLGNNSRSIE